MEKKAALNKMAQAVQAYINAERQFLKVAEAIKTYQNQQMLKAAGIMDLFKAKAPPPPPPSNTGRNLAGLAALLGLGGAGAYAYGKHKDDIRQTAGDMTDLALRMPAGAGIGDVLKMPQNIMGAGQAGLDKVKAMLQQGTEAGKPTAELLQALLAAS